MAPQEAETTVAQKKNYGSSSIDEAPPRKNRVTVVGSGNWGSVAAKLIASNTIRLPSFHGNLPFLCTQECAICEIWECILSN